MSLVLEVTLNLKTALITDTKAYEPEGTMGAAIPPPSYGNYAIFRVKGS